MHMRKLGWMERPAYISRHPVLPSYFLGKKWQENLCDQGRTAVKTPPRVLLILLFPMTFFYIGIPRNLSPKPKKIIPLFRSYSLMFPAH